MEPIALFYMGQPGVQRRIKGGGSQGDRRFFAYLQTPTENEADAD